MPFAVFSCAFILLLRALGGQDHYSWPQHFSFHTLVLYFLACLVIFPTAAESCNYHV
jgi:hypothetical protein